MGQKFGASAKMCYFCTPIDILRAKTAFLVPTKYRKNKVYDETDSLPAHTLEVWALVDSAFVIYFAVTW